MIRIKKSNAGMENTHVVVRHFLSTSTISLWGMCGSGHNEIIDVPRAGQAAQGSANTSVWSRLPSHKAPTRTLKKFSSTSHQNPTERKQTWPLSSCGRQALTRKMSRQ